MLQDALGPIQRLSSFTMTDSERVSQMPILEARTEVIS